MDGVEDGCSRVVCWVCCVAVVVSLVASSSLVVVGGGRTASLVWVRMSELEWVVAEERLDVSGCSLVSELWVTKVCCCTDDVALRSD